MPPYTSKFTLSALLVPLFGQFQKDNSRKVKSSILIVRAIRTGIAPFVAAILASVALLAVLNALTLAPFDKFGGRSVVAFLICLVAIWAGAIFTIFFIKHTIL